MAASLTQALRHALRKSLSNRSCILGCQQLRSATTESSQDERSKAAVAWSKDGSTVFCWHPEEKFPYEHSQPLPRDEPDLREGDSVLKIQLREDYQNRFRREGPTDKELRKMFFTTKHIWFPNKRHMKRPKKIFEREAI